MANTTINTQSANYQTRLTQLQEIKAGYGPTVAQYLKVHVKDPEAARAWRQADPLLRELLQVAQRISKRVGGVL